MDELPADGANHVIGVQRNTTGDLYTTWDLEDKGLATIDRYSKGADAVQALKPARLTVSSLTTNPLRPL